MTTLALEACPACGARDAEVAELGLRRCAACGTVYAPEYADPDEVFVEGYFEGGAGSYGIDTAHPRFQAFMAEVCARRTEKPEAIVLGVLEQAEAFGSQPVDDRTLLILRI